MRSTDAILIVDDEPDALILLRRAMEKAGITQPIVQLGNGDDVISYLEGQGAYANRAEFPLPALVLMDFKLPRRTGAEVLAWIRSHPSFRVLPVVVLTSSRDHRDVARAYEAGANSYLVKPTSYVSLVEIMESVRMFWVTLNEPPVLLADRPTGS